MREIPLVNSDRPALVSDEDYDRVVAHGHWRLDRRSGRLPYVVRRGKIQGRYVLLHRFILDPPPRRIIDHRDGNRLNNTRENLRWTNSTLNARNAPPYRKRAAIRSQYKGVSWHKRNGMWQAQAHTRWGLSSPKYPKPRTIHIGYFKCDECAALAYDDAARRLFGSDWSRTNFPERHKCSRCAVSGRHLRA